MNYVKEIWKDIPGYENLYQASNLGRIKRLERKIIVYNNLTKQYNNIFLEEYIYKNTKNKYGYYFVNLKKGKIRKTEAVHRLVAKTFIDNKKNLKTVNHIDKNKLNNNVNNLEYMSIADNVKYSLNKPVYKIENGKYTKYESINEAGRKNNVNYQNIYKCCHNIRKTAGGYEWRFVNECN